MLSTVDWDIGCVIRLESSCFYKTPLILDQANVQLSWLYTVEAPDKTLVQEKPISI